MFFVSSWCVSSLGLHVQKDFRVCSLWCCRKMPGRFTCASTGAGHVHRLQHVSWFDPAFQFCPPTTSPASSCHKTPPRVVNVAHRSFPLVQNLPTLMMCPLTSHTWNVIEILRPSRSFIGTCCSLLCFSLCPLADTRWGFLLGSMAIHSKSRGEHTCSSARLTTNTCTTNHSFEWWNGSLCRIDAKMYPVS